MKTEIHKEVIHILEAKRNKKYMRHIKLDDDIIELLKAKLDKRGDELYMLDTKVINLKKRKAEVYKNICDIVEILEANGVTPQPSSWDRS